MSKKKLCNLIICDASGSMSNKSTEVRHGLNQLFTDIRESSGDIKNRTILCDFSSAGDFRVIIDTKNSDNLTKDIANSYRTRGMTALYDAIGMAFAKVNKTYDGVFVNIMTDGLENNSQVYGLKSIQKLIAKKRKKGWAITFMGTTEDALKEARALGVSIGNTYKYEDSMEGASSANVRRSNSRHRFVHAMMESPARQADVAGRLMVDDEDEES